MYIYIYIYVHFYICLYRVLINLYHILHVQKARNQKFKAWFHTLESKGVVISATPLDVELTTPVAFKSLLLYLYTGDAQAIVNAEMVFDILDLAHLYEVHDLEKYCLWFVESNMTETKAIDLLLWTR